MTNNRTIKGPEVSIFCFYFLQMNEVNKNIITENRWKNKQLIIDQIMIIKRQCMR